METILITGGCGFIGANFLNLYVPQLPQIKFVNIDKLTYAANPLSLHQIEALDNYAFEHVDICNHSAVNDIFKTYNPDVVIHFAAESHVDRSILGPREFLLTNVLGTLNLLEACRAHWSAHEPRRFHHVSTDEVYGSLGEEGYFTEDTAYDPSSPYSASKASSDHLVRAYQKTYDLKVTISNCSNNYGPYQFPEKLIPLMILNLLSGKELPVYGRGKNVRDWLFVADHCEAIMRVVQRGIVGETYNIGGNCEKTNIDVVNEICDVVASKTDIDRDRARSLVTFVEDRPGHDFRYAIDSTKIRTQLAWQPRHTFTSGLEKTVDWYLKNNAWVEKIITGEYRDWLELNYTQRGNND